MSRLILSLRTAVVAALLCALFLVSLHAFPHARRTDHPSPKPDKAVGEIIINEVDCDTPGTDLASSSNSMTAG